MPQIIILSWILMFSIWIVESAVADHAKSCEPLFMCPTFCMKQKDGCYVCDCGTFVGYMNHAADEIAKVSNGQSQQTGSQISSYTSGFGDGKPGNPTQTGTGTGFLDYRTMYQSEIESHAAPKPNVLPYSSSQKLDYSYQNGGNRGPGMTSFGQYQLPMPGMNCNPVSRDCPSACWTTDVFTGCVRCNCYERRPTTGQRENTPTPTPEARTATTTTTTTTTPQPITIRATTTGYKNGPGPQTTDKETVISGQHIHGHQTPLFTTEETSTTSEVQQQGNHSQSESSQDNLVTPTTPPLRLVQQRTPIPMTFNYSGKGQDRFNSTPLPLTSIKQGEGLRKNGETIEMPMKIPTPPTRNMTAKATMFREEASDQTTVGWGKINGVTPALEQSAFMTNHHVTPGMNIGTVPGREPFFVDENGSHNDVNDNSPKHESNFDNKDNVFHEGLVPLLGKNVNIDLNDLKPSTDSVNESNGSRHSMHTQNSTGRFNGYHAISESPGLANSTTSETVFGLLTLPVNQSDSILKQNGGFLDHAVNRTSEANKNEANSSGFGVGGFFGNVMNGNVALYDLIKDGGGEMVANNYRSFGDYQKHRQADIY